jgi:hypothetical protein
MANVDVVTANGYPLSARLGETPFVLVYAMSVVTVLAFATSVPGPASVPPYGREYVASRGGPIDLGRRSSHREAYASRIRACA